MEVEAVPEAGHRERRDRREPDCEADVKEAGNESRYRILVIMREKWARVAPASEHPPAEPHPGHLSLDVHAHCSRPARVPSLSVMRARASLLMPIKQPVQISIHKRAR
jgi:hypothetical protein